MICGHVNKHGWTNKQKLCFLQVQVSLVSYQKVWRTIELKPLKPAWLDTGVHITSLLCCKQRVCVKENIVWTLGGMYQMSKGIIAAVYKGYGSQEWILYLHNNIRDYTQFYHLWYSYFPTTRHSFINSIVTYTCIRPYHRMIC